VLPPELQVVLGTGLLGGYTTFSTASVETVRLARAGRYRAALLHSVGLLVTCTVCATLGLLLGTALAG
jgi:CrcB protein